MKQHLLFPLVLLFTMATGTAQILDTSLLEVNASGGSSPQNMTLAGNRIFFTAIDGNHGRELWILDTATDTYAMVADILPGEESSVGNVVYKAMGDVLYFTADNGLDGMELWRSDGTAAGTIMVRDIHPSQGSAINEMAVFDGRLYFNADDGTNGLELWVSDGTSAGTVMLKDINPGATASAPAHMFLFDNRLYFTALKQGMGREIWSTDGTEAGTQLLMDINGTATGVNDGFIVFQNFIYFAATQGNQGYELWRSDGTTAGTSLFKEINPGSGGMGSTLRGAVTDGYFAFQAAVTGIGVELWRCDGTEAGTSILVNLNGANNGLLSDTEFAVFGDKVLYTAYENASGIELWVTDGSEAGTHLLKDIYAGPDNSYVTSLTATPEAVVFSAQSDLHPFDTLWKSDGTIAGTVETGLLNMSQDTSTALQFLVLGNTLWFQGGADDLHGNELYRTQLNPQTVTLVADIFHKYSANFGFQDYVTFGDKIVFSANDGISGLEPFITDGTPAGTHLINDIYPDGYDSLDNDTNHGAMYTVAGNTVFFRAGDGIHGNELHKTDGAACSLVKDIGPGLADGIPEYAFFAAYNDMVYFTANDGAHGQELWRSDGTESGTYLLKDINAGMGNGVFFSNFETEDSYFALLNGYLYFTAYNGTEYAIWRTDGTPDGTVAVVVLAPTPSGQNVPAIIENTANLIYFRCKSYTMSGSGIGISDGTQAGTSIVTDFSAADTLLHKYAILNNEVYFAVVSGGTLRFIKTNGTVSGTVTLMGAGATTYSDLWYMVPCGSNVYYIVAGKEVWHTDGTAAGTVLAESFQPGFDSYGSGACIGQSFLYSVSLLSTQHDSTIHYLNPNTNNPGSFDVVLSNAKPDEYCNITVLGEFDGRMLFRGSTDQSGSEPYIANAAPFLSIPEIPLDETGHSGIQLSPNPSEGIFTITNTDKSPIESITVYDITGKQCGSYIVGTTAAVIDMTGIASGLYLVKIKMPDDVVTKKMVLRR